MKIFKFFIILFLIGLTFSGCAGKKNLAAKSEPRFIVYSASDKLPNVFCEKVAYKIGGCFVANMKNSKALEEYLNEINTSKFYDKDKVTKIGNWSGANYILKIEPSAFHFEFAGGYIVLQFTVYEIDTGRLLYSEELRAERKKCPMLLEIPRMIVALVVGGIYDKEEVLKEKLLNKIIEQITINEKQLKKLMQKK